MKLGWVFRLPFGWGFYVYKPHVARSRWPALVIGRWYGPREEGVYRDKWTTPNW